MSLITNLYDKFFGWMFDIAFLEIDFTEIPKERYRPFMIRKILILFVIILLTVVTYGVFLKTPAENKSIFIALNFEFFYFVIFFIPLKRNKDGVSLLLANHYKNTTKKEIGEIISKLKAKNLKIVIDFIFSLIIPMLIALIKEENLVSIKLIVLAAYLVRIVVWGYTREIIKATIDAFELYEISMK